jgi:hypothetical protein
MEDFQDCLHSFVAVCLQSVDLVHREDQIVSQRSVPDHRGKIAERRGELAELLFFHAESVHGFPPVLPYRLGYERHIEGSLCFPRSGIVRRISSDRYGTGFPPAAASVLPAGTGQLPDTGAGWLLPAAGLAAGAILLGSVLLGGTKLAAARRRTV